MTPFCNWPERVSQRGSSFLAKYFFSFLAIYTAENATGGHLRYTWVFHPKSTTLSVSFNYLRSVRRRRRMDWRGGSGGTLSLSLILYLCISDQWGEGGGWTGEGGVEEHSPYLSFSICVSQISEEEEEDGQARGEWGNKLDFLFSCISVSVGE